MSDAEARLRALDPTTSFIVQAPAGSGKTELLIQRFLKLLTYTDKVPEEIIAITFTRKAANEMRARLLHALENALTQAKPEAPHALQTWQLAQNVLVVDKQRNWNLLQNPNRLQIQTIDSLCSKITAQMPVLAKLGRELQIEENAEALYAKAVREILLTLADNVPWQDALTVLLIHLDNDYNKAERLLIDMLARRDQWLNHVINRNPRQTLEDSLVAVIQDHLEKFVNHLPPQFASTLMPLLGFASTQVETTSDLALCRNLSELPEANANSLHLWQAIAKLLLTSTGQWRKSFTKNQGFPAPSSAKNSEIKNLLVEMKCLIESFVASLSEKEELRLGLNQLLTLPPSRYTDADWQIIQALVELLPILVAQLQLIFQTTNRVDHTEVALHAGIALGTSDEPTDLALALDYKIKHILVDEFQDTSFSQYQLLLKLTAGWQNQDGRTLFLVGDPMQSIYRFRKAEVGIFLQARENGFGNIQLEPLTLRVNFRSTSKIIQWINQSFATVLPKEDDLVTGAISFHPSTPQNNSTINHEEEVNYHFFVEDRKQQIATLVSTINKAWKKNPSMSIAILVMSRNHLLEIIPALKQANINYRALEIEKLAHKSVIQDLLALTRALLFLGDRTAWLSIIRAPWCGLKLADLLKISGDSLQISIAERLTEFSTLALSEDAEHRLQRFYPTIKLALENRQRMPLASWIKQTWLGLGGPACISQESDLKDAEAFFNLLEKIDTGGDIIDFYQLEKLLMNLAANTESPTTPFVDIMTIHKSKGLEFDMVLLPCLDKKLRHDDHQLLMWQEIPLTNGQSHLLFAPIKITKEEPIYDFLRSQEKTKARYEMGRLLYVATTRAKHSLHLFAECQIDKRQGQIKQPVANSLIEQLWPVVREHCQGTLHNQLNLVNPTLDLQQPNDLVSKLTQHRLLRRLSSNWQSLFPMPLSTHTKLEAHRTRKFSLDNHDSRKHIGTVIHQLLQYYSLLPQQNWDPHLPNNKINFIKQTLINLGTPISELAEAVEFVILAMTNTFSCERGRWILNSSHHEARSEFPLTCRINNQKQHCIIDRTFVENGIRWIIDYKTVFQPNDFSQQAAENSLIENLIMQQKTLYQNQLEVYATGLRLVDARPIRLGLYFPLLKNNWVEWAY